ncbi:hydroxymethylglutaryl-CoA lyase [Oceanibacterium hippocampi]|uniref:hydroxymethylglutaryl-CoA lyase n=1 Tax=Oceanibacterium hippocampi TaxID=745714 RepID=A0A1Y5SIC2_9PROT|nr:hydroxymethylglutaryl-CoA lyase [Oceanibacterium hippocampi]SLN40795.1 Hydroxymethylglutaryl-CoA lyase YngG [Oceanibacterium hippocampi]
MAWPTRVRMFEVGPRDGLQNEKQEVSPAVKAELVDRLVAAGIGTVEAASFVSPKWVPQMAGSAEVMAAIHRVPGARYTALTPNMRGFEAAREAGVDEVAVFAAASEGFSRKNINCSVAESLEMFRPVVEAAKAAGLPVRGYVSCVLGCPFDGDVPPGDVARVAAALYGMGCYEVSLGDTIGVGTPARARAMLEAVAGDIPVEKIGVHYHDTYGQALANILASLEFGIATIDSSVAGLGGCPYAPGATGNVATEDVVYMLDGLGIETGIDLEALVRTAWWISDRLGRPPVSRVARAMKARLDQA